MPDPRFDVRLVAYAAKGVRLGLLPTPLELQAAFPHNDMGALTASYSRHALRGELLDRALSSGLEIAVEVTTHDGGWVEPDGGRFVWVARESDLTDRAGLVKITAPSWGWLLSKARLLSLDHLLPPEHSQAGRRPFYSATTGTIIRTLMAENAARGGVPVGLTFQTGTDSAGAAWANVATLYYEPGLEVSVILGNLADQGMVDWRTRGRDLYLWNADTVCAPDLATTVRLHLGRDVDEAPSSESIQDVVSRVLLRGDGMALTLDNPTAPTPWGAWEGYLSQGGVSDPATATQLVQTELDRRARTTAQYTRSLILPGSPHWPMVDYKPGAWITAPTSQPAERVRVAQVTITKGADGVGGSVVLNDRILDAELRRAKRISGIVGGSQADGGAGTRPAPEGPDRRTPAAPLGLVVDTDAYLDPAGIARGLVTAGWSDVTTATDGTAMEIAGYDLALRDNVVGAPWSVVRTTEDTTVTYGPAEVGRVMQAKVRAVGRYSSVPGIWSSAVTFTVEDDVTPPPVPTVPTVAVDRAVVQVRWNGMAATGGTMPADFHRVELEREAAAGQVAGTILDAIGGTVLIAYLPIGTPQRFRARAVDRTGNVSAWSGWSAYVTPTPLVAADIDDTITDAIVSAQNTADAALTSADGKNRVWFQAAQPSGTAHAVGDTWFDTDDGNRIHRWSGSAWVAAQLGTNAIANGAVTATQIASAVNTQITQAAAAATAAQQAAANAAASATAAQTTADGKNRVLFGASAPTSTTPGRPGDLFWVQSGSTITGQYLCTAGTMAATGNVWAVRTLTSATIANLDAGKITTGYLDAARISAGMITGAMIAADAITATHIAAGAVTASELAAGAIVAGSAVIANGAIGTAQIGTGQITNALIADATIQAAKIASVDAGTITAGYLAAARIAAGTITTDKLIVSAGVNAVPNASFEQGLSGWTTHARYHVVTTEFRTGASSVQVDAAAGTGTIRPVADIPVQAGERWLFTAWCKTTANYNGTAGNGKLRIASQSGALLGAVAWPVTTTWQQVSWSYTVPAGVYAVRPELTSDHTAGTLWIDDVAAARMTDGQLIVDGEITTAKLAAGAVTAYTIAANAITADAMSVGALDGYVITGATIRTAASGARVELAGTTLRAYNAAGTVTAEISGASSTFTGSTFRTSATPTAGGVIIDATGLRAYNTSGAVTAQIAAASSTITGGTVQSTASAVGTGSGYRVSGTTYEAWNGTSRVTVTPTAYSAVPGILMHYGGAVAGMLYGPAANQVTLAYTDSTNYTTLNKDGIYVKASNNSTQPTYDRVLQATNRTFQASGIFHQTTTLSANLNVRDATGTVYRVDSVRRAKLLIDDAPDMWRDLVYQLRPVTWYDRSAHDSYADQLTAVANGELDTAQGSSIIGRRIPGFVAEEVEAAGLTEFCTYDDDGNLIGLAYDRIVAAVIPAMRDLRDRLTALETS